MAAPFPPAGNQSQHTERPVKIYAEQYLEGAPLPVGAVIDFAPTPDLPPLWSDGVPRVPLVTGWIALRLTDWVISNRYTGQPIEVISAEEFAERFGPSEL
jgi:hypothetical protein